MEKPKESLTANELLETINKYWADTKDIMQLGMIGRNKALEIKKEISDGLKEKGYKLPQNYVPMEKVVDYFKINISYLRKVK